MPEDALKHFELPNFTTPMPGTIRGVLDNDTAPRDKIFLGGLGMKEVKTGVLSMILKTGMEVAQYYTVFNYGSPIPQKDLKSKVRTILAQPGMKTAPKFTLPGHSKEKLGRTPPPDALIMDDLEKLLSTTVDKACGNSSGSLVEMFIKLEHQQFFPPSIFIGWARDINSGLRTT